ncbi:hypothetical protein LDBUL1519_00747 [Lactobacillus delbrueckii subsp. bulgaricus CNCM I-1519]|nr:hypothetical protein LDBUL1519_00747 [Lactobacillus delbrueckii subsp. bulgaricus CNCM I-1519]
MKKYNINVEERIRELSTIKVLGFFDQETTLYIYRETIILYHHQPAARQRHV